MKNVEKPLVSICVLTYNHEAYLRQALDSFLAQKTNFSYEIVLHDDASTDGTIEILKEYDQRYPNVFQMLIQEENQYSKGNYNISGLFNFPRARGRYIAYCEGDDYWTDENKLQKQVDYMEKHPECSLCFHAIEDVDKNGNLLATFRAFSHSKVVSMEEVITSKRVFSFASFMFRAEYVRELPQFYFDCPVGDLPLVLHLAAKGEVYFMDEVMAAYRNQSSGSWTNTMWSGDYQERLRVHLEKMKRMYRDFNQYTEGAYSKEVGIAIRKQDFEYTQGSLDFKGMLKKEYRYYFRQLPWQARVGAYIGAVSPKLFQILRPKKEEKGKK